MDFITLGLGVVGLGLTVLIAIQAASRNFLIDKHKTEMSRKDMEITNLKKLVSQLKTELSDIENERGVSKHTFFSGEKRADPNAPENYYDKIFTLEDSVAFYDAISNEYDKRNVGQYGKTYDRIYELINKHSEISNSKSLCDLGGGTGWLLNKFRHLNLSWVNIDLSPGVLRIFKNNFDDYENKECRQLDITEDCFRLTDNFDYVVVNFVLSSMQGSMNFSHLKKSMKPGALLIISDNHHTYVESNSIYGFEDIGGKNIGISPKPMFPEQIKSSALNDGFEHVESTYVEVKNRIYSQIHLFRAPTRIDI